MFTFHFPPFLPFVCQTKPDMETTKIQKTRKWAWPMERSIKSKIFICPQLTELAHGQTTGDVADILHTFLTATLFFWSGCRFLCRPGSAAVVLFVALSLL